MHQFKHVFWVLKGTVSWRRFFLSTKNICFGLEIRAMHCRDLRNFIWGPASLNSINIYLLLLVLSADYIASSFDPDQARPNVGPDLDPNCLTL